jgi:hypothetical protein
MRLSCQIEATPATTKTKNQIQNMNTYKVTAQTGVNYTNENKTDSATVVVSAKNFKDAWGAGETEIRKTNSVCIVTDISKI